MEGLQGVLEGGQTEELYKLLGAAHAAARPASEHERDRCPPLPYFGPSAKACTPLGNLTGGLQAALAFEAALDGAGAGLADAFYLVELSLRGVE